MRYLLVLFVLVGSLFACESYQDKVNSFMEKRKEAKPMFSKSDMKVMKESAKELAISIPHPGLKVGDMVPDFTLKNAFGKEVNLYTELKKGPVVLVFYRGAWCPFCNMHLHSLFSSLDEFKKYNAQLITITPQTPDKSADQIKKDGYSFEVLSDLSSSVMKDYNLYFEIPSNLVAIYKKAGLNIESFNGKDRNVLPVPGTFVIDQKGIIQAVQADTDYKKRMEPSDIVKALKAL